MDTKQFPPGEAAWLTPSSRETTFQLRQEGGRNTVKRFIMQNGGSRGLAENQASSREADTAPIAKKGSPRRLFVPTVLFMWVMAVTGFC